jgi:hypothetical protein
MDRFNKCANKFRQPDQDIVMLPLFHGTKKSLIPAICATGFAALCNTDAGMKELQTVI